MKTISAISMAASSLAAIISTSRGFHDNDYHSNQHSRWRCRQLARGRGAASRRARSGRQRGLVRPRRRRARLHAVGREPADRGPRAHRRGEARRSPGRPRAVSITEAGELLLRHAEAIVDRLEAARADMASLRAGETGTLRVGTYQSSAPACSRRDAPVHGRLARNHLRAVGAVQRSETLYRGIESGDSISASAASPLPDGPFDSLELISDPYVLIVPSDSPLAAREASRSPISATVPMIGSNVFERQRRRGCATARRADRVRVPVRRQQDRAGARGGRVRRRADAAARRDAGRRAREGDRGSSRRSRAAGSASSGTATGTAHRRPAHSSRSPDVSAEVEQGLVGP